MLFFKDKKTGKECLSLAEDGSKQNYECIFSACPNPVCTCMTLDIDLAFIPDQNHGDLPKLCHSVEIDLDKRKLQTSSKKNCRLRKRLLETCFYPSLEMMILNSWKSSILTIKIRLQKQQTSTK